MMTISVVTIVMPPYTFRTREQLKLLSVNSKKSHPPFLFPSSSLPLPFLFPSSSLPLPFLFPSSSLPLPFLFPSSSLPLPFLFPSISRSFYLASVPLRSRLNIRLISLRPAEACGQTARSRHCLLKQAGPEAQGIFQAQGEGFTILGA